MSAPKLKTKKRIASKAKNSTKYKVKVHSSAKKRFKLSADGLSIKAPQANKRHNMRKRSKRQIRNNRGTVILDKGTAIPVLKYANLHLN